MFLDPVDETDDFGWLDASDWAVDDLLLVSSPISASLLLNSIKNMINGDLKMVEIQWRYSIETINFCHKNNFSD